MTLTHDFSNIYLGADMDSDCMGYPPFNQKQVEKLVFLWYNKILEKVKPKNINKYFSFCSNQNGEENFLFIVIVGVIFAFLCMGCFYCREYYIRKKYYEELISGNNDDE